MRANLRGGAEEQSAAVVDDVLGRMQVARMAFMQALVAVVETGEEGREEHGGEQWNRGTYLSIEMP